MQEMVLGTHRIQISVTRGGGGFKAFHQVSGFVSVQVIPFDAFVCNATCVVDGLMMTEKDHYTLS